MKGGFISRLSDAFLSTWMKFTRTNQWDDFYFDPDRLYLL
jgi:hypothetical protein